MADQYYFTRFQNHTSHTQLHSYYANAVSQVFLLSAVLREQAGTRDFAIVVLYDLKSSFWSYTCIFQQLSHMNTRIHIQIRPTVEHIDEFRPNDNDIDEYAQLFKL